MKRLFLIAAVLALFFSLASCGSAPKAAPSPTPEAPSAPESAPVPSSTVVETAPAVTPEPAPAVEQVPVQTAPVVEAVPQQQTPVSVPTVAPVSQAVTVEGGGYSVDILSAYLDKDYTGAQVVVVKFMFTNNNSESTCFGDVVNPVVSQNGSVLNGESVIMDSNNFGGLAFNFRESVSNGASIPCVFAYPYYGNGDLNVSLQILSDNNARQVLASGSTTLSIG